MTAERESRNELLEEYRRRACRYEELAERSSQMERDFLENKVLNAHANEAMNAARLEKSLFSMWLFDHHEELFATRSEKGAPEPIREALAELVRLKDIAYRVENRAQFGIGKEEARLLEKEYKRLRPLAWEAARQALAAAPALPPTTGALEAMRSTQRDMVMVSREWLAQARCPNRGCDGNGTIARSNGQGDWETEQCQWCDYRAHLAPPSATGDKTK